MRARIGMIWVPRNRHSSRSLSPRSPNWNLIPVAAYLVSISLDGSFFYALYVDGHRKCLVLNKDLAFTLAALRTFLDGFLIVYLYFIVGTRGPVPHSIHGRGSQTSKRTVAKNFLWFLIDVVSVLPLPLVVLCLAVTKMRGHKFLSAISLFKSLVLPQFLPRFVSMYHLFIKAPTSSGTFPGLGNGIFHFLVYLLVCHSFGAMWYFLAIERVSECWKEACLHVGCSHDSFYCNDKFGDHWILNAFCPTKLEHPTSFDFGMFHDAFQSGIVEVPKFLPKFLYCLQWGIRSLCFAHGFQTSTIAWENIFSIAMTITGAVFLPVHLCNVMDFLQHINRNWERKIERSSQMKEIEMRELFRVLSIDLKQKIRDYFLSVCEGPEGFNLHQFFNGLPAELSLAMKHELCLPLLKEVPIFSRMDEQQMNALLDHFKLVLYTQGTFLVSEGMPGNKLQLIVGGDTWSWNSTRAFTPHGKDGVCGEKLVSWAVAQQSNSNIGFPRSTRTVEAVTDVDAFCIEASDLKEFFSQFRQPNGQLPRYFRYRLQEWRDWYRWRKEKLQKLAATTSQLAGSGLRPMRP